ncbi:MAG: hypothetical protein IT372_31290 [Polyangiaceae bacterium]|nr:hypothetical protein [Polyangiaceae bacterium]
MQICGIVAALAVGACSNADGDRPPAALPDVTPIDTRPATLPDDVDPPVVPSPRPLAPAPGEDEKAAGGEAFEGTTGVAEKQRPGARPVVLRDVRAGGHEGFDRIVFELAGDELPGYRVAYSDKPPLHCGSGKPVEVAGRRWLEVRLTPAQAHDEAGKVTITERERKTKLEVVQELELTCDFEGQVSWALGVSSPNAFRVLELSKPARLVVDVKR